MFVTGL